MLLSLLLFFAWTVIALLWTIYIVSCSAERQTGAMTAYIFIPPSLSSPGVSQLIATDSSGTTPTHSGSDEILTFITYNMNFYSDYPLISLYF